VGSGASAVLNRARASLDYPTQKGRLLSIGLDQCTIGHTLAALDADPAEADTALDLAIETMRRASTMYFLPVVHLTRAQHRRVRHDPAGVRADLDAALAVAGPAGMRTPLAEAARQWTLADQLIRATGYGRREAELHLVEARLAHHQRRPDEARVAQALAEARIRAIGQWGLWPDLTRVAAELGLPPPTPPETEGA